MDKEALISLIHQNPVWDAEELLHHLDLTWDELINLLKDCSDSIEWTLHSRYSLYFLPDLTSYHTLVNRSFEFHIEPSHSSSLIGTYPVHCRCTMEPYDL